MNDSYAISIYVQQAGSLLIALLGVVYFLKRHLPIKLLSFYGFNSVLFQTASTIIVYNHKARLYLNLNGNIYTLVETLILLLFFFTIYNSRIAKSLILVFASGYLILYFTLMPNHWTELESSIRTTRDLLVIVCSLMYFYFLLRQMPTGEITKYPMFWIVAAMLSFFAGTFALSVSIQYLVKVLHNDLALLWTMRNTFRFVFCLVVCYGLWLDLRQVRTNLTLTK